MCSKHFSSNEEALTMIVNGKALGNTDWAEDEFVFLGQDGTRLLDQNGMEETFEIFNKDQGDWFIVEKKRLKTEGFNEREMLYRVKIHFNTGGAILKGKNRDGWIIDVILDDNNEHHLVTISVLTLDEALKAESFWLENYLAENDGKFPTQFIGEYHRLTENGSYYFKWFV